jgi:hypothetical protein
MKLCMLMVTMMVASLSPAFAAPMWHPGVKADDADTYVAFRGTMELPEATSVELRLLGSSWYVANLDGEYLTEGPPRFPVKNPEYQSLALNLAQGKHVIAVEVHHDGLSTRMLEDLPGFLYCSVLKNGQEIAVDWKCLKLEAYTPKVRRINDQFGWMSWCDTRAIPNDWEQAAFDDSSWKKPGPSKIELGELKPLSTAEVKRFIHPLKPMAEGPLAETYGYERDNPSARFFLRDLECKVLPSNGHWRRYDLGRVRLGRPKLVLDLPAGAVVEIAYSEYLSHDRVSPWITLSASDSCNLDHFVARGGEQTFFPLIPKGGRFMEVHILGDPAKIRFVREEYVERCYYDVPEGSFTCDDSLLNQIWSVGVETHRACAEDALIDNPTRERGQWAGDVVSVGMDIAAAGYTDLRLCRRGLVQCAQSARPDGMVAGLCPGGAAFLSTYAAQWVTACLHYWELTGDRTLLEEMFDSSVRNLAAFAKFNGENGLSEKAGWGFVDWGYVQNDGPSDMGVNLHYLAALRDMARWCDVLGKSSERDEYAKQAKAMTGIVAKWFKAQVADGKPDWEKIGYHRTVLGLRLGFFTEKQAGDALAYIKRHILSCFPNNPDAPRLSDPGQNQPQLITPYFAHYTMPMLIERGEMDFVLDQYRKCWGWMLGEGRTTWIEVFDTRWSHCHQWAGCPTWQLSRYALGMTPRFDLGNNHFALTLKPGSLTKASGDIPIPGSAGKTIKVNWLVGTDGKISYTVDSALPITLHTDPAQPATVVEISGRKTLTLP